MRQGNVRATMAEGARQLLSLNGVDGTTFAEVLALTGAPRGSVYHHFPGGKSELIHAALNVANSFGRAELESVRGGPPVEVVETFLAQWRRLLVGCDLRAGCAVVAVAVAAGDDQLREHAGAVFREWDEYLAGLLVEGGVDAESAASLAMLVIAATEGAVVVSRAEGDVQPFESVATQLLELVAARAASGSSRSRSRRSPARR
jgi:TetR/AcrR family transcriptional regulator, lmrAB and yxaGH operons repressor